MYIFKSLKTPFFLNKDNQTYQQTISCGTHATQLAVMQVFGAVNSIFLETETPEPTETGPNGLAPKRRLFCS